MDQELRNSRKRVSICETQPLLVNGFIHLLASTDDLEFASAHKSPAEWMVDPQADSTDLLVVDKALGPRSVLQPLRELNASGPAFRSRLALIDYAAMLHNGVRFWVD